MGARIVLSLQQLARLYQSINRYSDKNIFILIVCVWGGGTIAPLGARPLYYDIYLTAIG